MAIDLTAFGTLPAWLREAADADRVGRSLVATVPDFRTGGVTLLDAELERIRLKDQTWRSTYRFTVTRPDSGTPSVVGLRGSLLSPPELPTMPPSTAGPPFGTDGWCAYLPDLGLLLETEPEDEALPALPELLAPDSARRLLERSIAAAGPDYDGFALESCDPQIVRYSPGSRCTIRYRLNYPAGVGDRGWPDIVVAKTYRGDKGRIAWNGMRALWESPMASSGVAIAEPLAFLDEMNVLVQGPIREQFRLTEAARRAVWEGTPAITAEAEGYVRGTAAGLAALHGSGVGLGNLVTWNDEHDEVRQVMDRLVSRAPSLSAGAEPLLSALAERAARVPADPAGPAHRSFRPAQVLISEGHLGFIDFDGFCQAEPAIDVALMRSSLKQLGMGEWERASMPADRVGPYAQLADTFLDAYERHAPISRVRVALWEALDLLTVVQHAWTKVKVKKL
ncbi:MAG: phosphotransferase, partial [Frankiaceae bacterium]